MSSHYISGPSAGPAYANDISGNIAKLFLARAGLYGKGTGDGEGPGETAFKQAQAAEVQQTIAARAAKGISDNSDLAFGLTPGTSFAVMTNAPEAASIPPAIRSQILGHVQSQLLLAGSGGNQNVLNTTKAQELGRQTFALPQATDANEAAANVGALLGKPTIREGSGILYPSYGDLGGKQFVTTPAAEALAAQRTARATDITTQTAPKVGLIEAKTGTEGSRQNLFNTQADQVGALTAPKVESTNALTGQRQASAGASNAQAAQTTALTQPKVGAENARAAASNAAAALSGARTQDVNVQTPLKAGRTQSQTTLNTERAATITARRPGQVELDKARTVKAKQSAGSKVTVGNRSKVESDIATTLGFASDATSSAADKYRSQVDPGAQTQLLDAYSRALDASGGDVAAARRAIGGSQLSPYEPEVPANKGFAGFGATPAKPAARSKLKGQVSPTELQGLGAGAKVGDVEYAPVPGSSPKVDLNAVKRQAQAALAAGKSRKAVMELYTKMGGNPADLK